MEPNGYYDGGTDSSQNYVSWDIITNGVSSAQSYFDFKILGLNPTYEEVDSYVADISGAPWFYSNMLSWESCATNTGHYNQFVESGMTCLSSGQSVGAPIFGGPHGFGMAQLESPTDVDWDFWDWTYNVYDGVSKLLSLQYGSPYYEYAYSFWAQQVSQWEADSAYATGTGTWNAESGGIRTSVDGKVPNSCFYDYCCFEYPQGGDDSYADGEWVKIYNGAATQYMSWINTVSGGAAGYWRLNDSANYVEDVCNAPVY
jgi:hypothetical protein